MCGFFDTTASHRDMWGDGRIGMDCKCMMEKKALEPAVEEEAVDDEDDDEEDEEDEVEEEEEEEVGGEGTWPGCDSDRTWCATWCPPMGNSWEHVSERRLVEEASEADRRPWIKLRI